MTTMAGKDPTLTVFCNGMPICGELITSGALLDYITDFDWDYLRIETPSC